MAAFFIPTGIDDAKANLGGVVLKRTIHDLGDGDFESGSNITCSKEQFALMRVVFPPRYSRRQFVPFSIGILHLAEARKSAREVLDNSPSFIRLLHVMREKLDVNHLKEDDEEWPGMFVPFLQFLEEMALSRKGDEHPPKRPLSSQDEPESSRKRPQRTSRVDYRETTPAEGETPEPLTALDDDKTAARSLFPEVEDEAIVNATCIFLLKSLGQLVENRLSKWTICRMSFKAQFRNGKYTARTDGALITQDHTVQGIIEAKPQVRSDIRESVMQQEAAKMVAWLQQDAKSNHHLPDLKGHRLLIAQDRHEMFLVFANPSEEYLQYLDPEANIKAKENNGFLKIQICGPWDLTKVDDINDICEVLLAVTILGSQAVSQEEEK